MSTQKLLKMALWGSERGEVVFGGADYRQYVKYGKKAWM